MNQPTFPFHTTSMNQQSSSTKALLRRLLRVMGLVWLLMPLTFVVPWLNSTAPPYFDLTSLLGVVAHRLAMTGGGDWGPWIVVSLILVPVSRPGLPIKRRLIEFVVIGVALLAVQGGGSLLNEVGLKEVVQEPRPHIKQLARALAGPTPPDGTILGMTADAFYDLPVAERRAHLCTVSGYDELEPSSHHCRSSASETPDSAASRRYCFEEYADETLHLHPRVCRHWISTTGGFSFPSGHAYSALFLATFFLGLALGYLSGWRLRFIQFLVVPWTILVAYSRPILRVHSPLDITVGGLLGVAFGVAAFVMVRAVLKRVGGTA